MNDADVVLLPARMLNEYVYCPRLFYLEWVQGEWQDSADTVEGRFHHRTVDREGGMLPAGASGEAEDESERTEAHGEEAGPGRAANTTGAGGTPTPGAEPTEMRIHARSVLLSSPRLRLVARIDLVEGDADEVIPVDYKRGHVPDNPERSWEPDRVQLCAQALLLREHGYRCKRGVIYYVGSRQRVEVEFTPELEQRTLELMEEALQVAAGGQVPPPLVDSPKCPRCSLVGICLPDEVNFLRSEASAGTSLGAVSDQDGREHAEVRRLFPARDDALAVYVQEQGAMVRRSGERLVVTVNGETRAEVRLLDVSQLCLLGNVQISSQALRELATRGIPICHFSYGGWFSAITVGFTSRNVQLRQRQYELAGDPTRCVVLARKFVTGKITNCRVLLRRNHSARPVEVIEALGRLSEQASRAETVESLLGIEGTAARLYFSEFAGMLKPPRPGEAELSFDFENRTRRPPKDPVNALLSYAYSLLVKDFTVVLLAVGFDPYLGFFHRPKWGKPALALDLMEEFRPVLADSVVLTVINNGELKPSDFVVRAGGVALTEQGRRKFIEAYERRMDAMVKHPVFGYSISYRRVLEVQARLLARFLLGEIPEYPPFVVR